MQWEYADLGSLALMLLEALTYSETAQHVTIRCVLTMQKHALHVRSKQKVMLTCSGYRMHPVRQRACLDGALAGDVIGADGQAGLACAEHARASAEMRLFVLLVHGSHAPGGEDVANMDQAIQHLCGSFHHLMLLL